MVSYSGRIQPQEEGDKERGSISMRKKTKKEKENPVGGRRYKTMRNHENTIWSTWEPCQVQIPTNLEFLHQLGDRCADPFFGDSDQK